MESEPQEEYYFSYFQNIDDLKTENLKKRISNSTEITRDHLTPELKLHLFTPNCPQFNDNKSITPFPEPFWGIYWAGGQVLTRYLLDNKDIVKGKTVLDLGSGCGATAIAATKFCEPNFVIANDRDPVAGYATDMNADLNDCPYLYITYDNFVVGERSHYKTDKDFDEAGEEDPKREKPDCIFVGHMFDDSEDCEILIKWLLKCAREDGSRVYIGDCGKGSKYFQDYAVKLKEYHIPLPTVVAQDLLYPTASVWVLRPQFK